ncbi:hypothetical protein IFO70_14890 [Phormidium tenue FACHB-886]|nr:hypothetical protein [Phormidium tenue FACHB-886]
MSQIDPIQALIHDIDEVLQKTTPRLPWVMSTDAMRQRQVLEQARTYLAELRSPVVSPEEASPAQASLLPSGQPAAESAQQVLQSVLQEMNYLRVNMLQPMRSDVELLRQQREALTHEVRQLEAQRQQYALPPQGNAANSQLLMEFLQSAMAQMQENLREQVVQMVASLSTDDQRLLGNADLSHSGPNDAALSHVNNSANLANSEAGAVFSPAQRLEQIQRVQTQSDQLLLKLDATLRVIFESLQSNLQSYQDSLEQGLNRIHSLGQQGEAVVAAMVARLAEQVGREASSYLQSAVQPTTPGLPAAIANATEKTDAEIARLLEELNALDAGEQPEKPATPIDTRWQLQPFTLDATPGSLTALSQELQRLDLSTVPIELEAPEDEEDLTIFQTEPTSTFPSQHPVDESIDNDSTQLQVDANAYSPEVEDLDSALDLLNQLGAEARVNADAAIVEQSATVDQPVPTELQAVEPPLVESPDSLYEDEFYQSLFGDSPNAANPSAGEWTIELAPESPVEVSLQPAEADVAFGSLFSGMEDRQLSETGADETPEELPHRHGDSDRSASEDLFEGLDDPSVAQPIETADANFLPEASSPTNSLPQDLPQATENLLLSEFRAAFAAEPEAETAIASASGTADEGSTEAPEAVDDTDLFWDVPEIAGTENLTISANTQARLDKIRSLTDLIPVASDADRLVDSEGFSEDIFEPAEAGEDLLALETPPPLPIAELEIDEMTLQQLAVDLSNLEQTTPKQAHEQAEPLASSAAGASIDDLFVPAADAEHQSDAAHETLEALLFTEDLPLDQPAPPTPTEPTLEAEPEIASDSNAFTLEGLDSLFETLPESQPQDQLSQSAGDVPKPEAKERSNLSIEEVFGDARPESQAAEPPAPASSPKKKI